MNEKAAIETLHQIKEVFDAHGIEYWLDMGALLGFVRNGKIIPWDHDIDLSTWHTQVPKIYDALQELWDKGFKLSFHEWKDCIFIHYRSKDCLISVSLYHLSNNKATKTWFLHNQMIIGQILDYFDRVLLPSEYRYEFEDSRIPPFITTDLYKIGDILPSSLRGHFIKTIRLVYKKIGCKQVHLAIPSYFFQNLSTIKFYGMELKVPTKTEEYLVYRYGKDWRIPKKKYVFYKEDGAICK